MSDSEESEDENVKLLLEAVDSNLLTDDLYKSKKDTIDTAEKSENINTSKDSKLPKSQRYIDLDNESNDLFEIPITMQQFFAKKLSNFISQRIEFIDIDIKEKKKQKKYDEIKTDIKLLKDFNISIIDNGTSSISYDNILQKKPKIKRRIIDNSDDNLTESEKCKIVAIEPDYIYSGKEIKHWSKRSKAEIFYYKKTKNKGPKNCFYYVEPKSKYFENKVL